MVSLAGGKNARARKVRAAGACLHSAPRLARITLTSHSGEAQLPSGAQGASRSAHHHLFAESRTLHGFFTSRVESKEMRAGSVSVRRHFRSASGTDALQSLKPWLSLCPGIVELSINNFRCRSKWVWLGFVRVENVNDFGSLCLQVIGDQAAMAFPPDCFCTHDRRRTPSLCRFLQACYSRDKLRCLHVVSVTAKRIVSPGSVA